MRRHCGRPGCNAVATATFSFDATRCLVWIDSIEDGMPRAGDLCARHADGMAPPKGWERVDRRSPQVPVSPIGEVVGVTANVAASIGPTNGGVALADSAQASDDLLPQRAPAKRKRKAAPKKRWDEVPSLFAGASEQSQAVSPPSTEGAASEPAPIVDISQGAASTTAWMPRFATQDDLEGVLDASTPLLARAFNNARPADVDAVTEDETSSTPNRGETQPS